VAAAVRQRSTGTGHRGTTGGKAVRTRLRGTSARRRTARADEPRASAATAPGDGARRGDGPSRYRLGARRGPGSVAHARDLTGGIAFSASGLASALAGLRQA